MKSLTSTLTIIFLSATAFSTHIAVRKLDMDNVIHMAARAGDINGVQEQLALGALVDLRTSTGATSLHIACNNGHLAIVELLLINGADPNALEANKKMATTKAPLDYAVSVNHQQIIETLLNAGAEINRQDPLGYTALHIAYMMGHEEAKSVLKARGARGDLKTRYGELPKDFIVQ